VRSIEIDLGHCGAELKIIATNFEVPVMVAILKHPCDAICRSAPHEPRA